MTVMSPEEVLVIYTSVGITATVCRRRFELLVYALPVVYLSQVAVKAFRFTFAINGVAGVRSVKVARLTHNQKCSLNCFVDASSGARNLEKTRSQKYRSVLGHCIWVRDAGCTVLGVVMDA